MGRVACYLAARMLKTLRVRQYKSLERIELPLGGLTVLVGPNAAGKSNLIDALRLLQDGLREDMRSAVKRRGDRAVLFESKAQSRWGDALELEIDCWLPGLPKTAWLDFHLQYDFRYSAGSVREETLDLRKSKPDRRLNRIYSARDGQLEFGVHRANGDAFKSPEPGLLALKAISYLKNFDEVRQVRSFIESWRFLVPEVAKIREPRRLSREDVLESSGGNLANVLRTLDDAKSPALPRIIEDLKTLLGFVEEVRTETERGQVSLLLREKGRATDLESLHLSDGTLRLLAILTALHTLPSPGLLCIEEPEHGLHPALLGPLCGALRSVCEPRGGRQVILTTHSADLVDYIEPSELRPLARGEQGQTVLHKLDKRQLARWVKDFRLGELWKMRRVGGVP